MKFKLVSDSSSNVLEFADIPFESVPLKIITEEKEYVDDANLDVAAMVEDLRTVKGKTGTSCPHVSEYLDAFEGAENVFVVTITSNLSGSCAAAIQAAAEYEETHEGAHVHVVDSLSTGAEMRLILEHMRERILAGDSFEQVRDSVREYQKNTHLLFSLQSLANLARNGRVSPAVAKLAGVLGIRILGMASDEGTLQPLHKCRGEKKMLDTMVEEMISRGFNGGKVRITHCLNMESALELKTRLLAKFPAVDISIEPSTGLCSFYAERGSVMVGFEGSLA